jgi:hypothetical protein
VIGPCLCQKWFAHAFVKNDWPLPLSKMIGPCPCQKWQRSLQLAEILTTCLDESWTHYFHLWLTLDSLFSFVTHTGLIIFICDSRWTHYFHLWLMLDSLFSVVTHAGLIIFSCDSRWTHYFHLWLTKVFKNVIWTHQIKLLQVHVSLIYWYMYVQVHGMSCKMVNVTLCRYILLGKFFTSNSNLTTYNNTIKIIIMVDNIATEIMSVKTISIFVFFFCSSYRVYLMTYFIYFKYWI